MSPSPKAPDEHTLQAWLAGTLNAEETRRIESYFEENPPSDEPLSKTLKNTLHSARIPYEHAEEMAQLITQLGQKSTLLALRDFPPFSWNEILSPSSLPDVLGLLADYEVLAILAENEMGAVFEARDPRLQRMVALKVLAPNLACHPAARENFLREARAVASLDHESILPIYHVAEDPTPWFAMKYAAGGSLQEALDHQEEFPPERLRSLAQQATSALAAAHHAGIVHRDLKPANILLLDDRDRIAIADFGIALTLSEEAQRHSGELSGTPHYMAPEQALGKPCDERSDLFSLASVLYHCATGQRPFSGKSTKEILHAVVHQPPPPIQTLNPLVSPRFAQILEKLHAKDPAARFANAPTLLTELHQEENHAARRRFWQRPFLISILALCLLSLALLQIPTVCNLANQGLIRISGHGITIRDQLGTHTSLKYAIAAAPPHGIIELHGKEPMPLGLIVIPENKPLTIRAASKTRPVIRSIDANSHLKTLAPLRLEGLTFQWPTMNRTSPGSVTLVGGEHLIRDCTFEAFVKIPNPNNAARPAVIQTSFGAKVRVEDCRFRLVDASVASLSDPRKPEEQLQPGEIHFHHSLLTGSRALTFFWIASETTAQVTFEDCLVATDTVVMSHWNSPLKPIEIRSRGTIFAPKHSYLWAARETPQEIASCMAWHSRDDVFRSGLPFVSTASVLARTRMNASFSKNRVWSEWPQGNFQDGFDLPFPFPGPQVNPAKLADQLGSSLPESFKITLRSLSASSDKGENHPAAP